MKQLPSFNEMLKMSDGEKHRLRNDILDEMLRNADPDKKKLILDTQRKVGQIIFKHGDDHLGATIEICTVMMSNLLLIGENQAESLEVLCEVIKETTKNT